MTIIHHPSPNFEPRTGSVIDMLVLHYTGMVDGASALARLCDPEAKVSASNRRSAVTKESPALSAICCA